jgi:hypothetical protein
MAAAVEMTRTEPRMNTFTKTPRTRSSAFVVISVSLLFGSLSGCYIDAKIGNDPEGDTEQATEGEGSTTAFPGTASATSTSGTVTATSATFTTADPSATTFGSTGMVPVDQETALELCGVVVVPPEPGGPLFYEGLECHGGCVIDLESGEPIGLYAAGQCVCDAMDCGELGGGTTGELPGRETDSTTGGEPDGCGPFPPGESGFTCTCEVCSIEVTNIDAEWLASEADLEVICECMCGGAGCGSPI